jgi:hypothetical protein
VGEGISNDFAGDSRCRARVILRTFAAQTLAGGLQNVELVRLAEPSPNPASSEVSLLVERLLDAQSNEPVSARCILKDLLGNSIAEGEYESQTRFTEGAGQQYERGIYRLRTQHITSGAYMLLVQTAQGVSAAPVVIQR